jgi:hypothetical protein
MRVFRQCTTEYLNDITEVVPLNHRGGQLCRDHEAENSILVLSKYLSIYPSDQAIRS